MELFPPQKEVIENGYIDADEHVLLNMATGSGKTFLSEMAIRKAVESGYKAIYITPLRAIAKQQGREWEKKFTNCKVGVFTGETIRQTKAQPSYVRFQILIMTPERFDACLRNWRTHWSWLPDVNLVVIDEFHILGQRQRGSRLEGAITRMIRLNPFVRLIGLSATMPNYAELASWLHGRAYHSSWRQIEIRKVVDRFSSAKEKPGKALEHVRNCIAHGGQSIVFCSSRSKVQQLTAFFCENGIPATSHHAGLTSGVRSEHEAGFVSGRFKVMAATSTVEMGLNFPARQVIIYDSFSYADMEFTTLPVWSYIQRMGRAGRPGLDTSGECVLLLAKWSGDAERYLAEKCEPVVSQLTDKRAMMEQILVDVYAGYSRTRNELIHGFLPLTFYKAQHPEADMNGIVNGLVRSGLLMEISDRDKDGSVLKVGLLGRMAVKLMLSPGTIMLIEDAKKKFARLSYFDLLMLSCMCSDCSPVLSASYEEMDTLCEIVQPLPGSLLELTVEELPKKLPEAPGTLRILAAIKMAAICYSITEGKSFEEIAELFEVYESDIRMLQENVVRLLRDIGTVSTAIDKHELTEDAFEKQKKDSGALTNVSNMLSGMLQYGIDCKTAALVCLQGVGGKTARRLAAAGYASIPAIKKASADELSAVDGIGRKLAESICEQVSKMRDSELPQYTEERAVEFAAVRAVKTPVDSYRLRRSMELSVKGKDGGRFCITGGREDHIVTVKNGEMRCDCPDYQKNRRQCKHIICVKRMMGDAEITKMVKRIRENKSHSIREALPSLWYAMNTAEGR